MESLKNFLTKILFIFLTMIIHSTSGATNKNEVVFHFLKILSSDKVCWFRENYLIDGLSFASHPSFLDLRSEIIISRSKKSVWSQIKAKILPFDASKQKPAIAIVPDIIMENEGFVEIGRELTEQGLVISYHSENGYWCTILNRFHLSACGIQVVYNGSIFRSDEAEDMDYKYMGDLTARMYFEDRVVDFSPCVPTEHQF